MNERERERRRERGAKETKENRQARTHSQSKSGESARAYGRPAMEVFLSPVSETGEGRIMEIGASR